MAEALRALDVPALGFGFGRHDTGPEVLTDEQLAELLQVDVKTVRSLAARAGSPVGRRSRMALLTPRRARLAAG